MIYEWCLHKSVYEWFEQKKLSFEEIKTKYQNKIKNSDQELFIIEFHDKAVGLIQIYYYDKTKNAYEFDLFIGDNNYLSKGIGYKTIMLINNYLFKIKQASFIILRPFKRNIRAINCYLKAGYKIEGEYLSKDTIGNDEIIVLMQKNNNIFRN